MEILNLHRCKSSPKQSFTHFPLPKYTQLKSFAALLWRRTWVLEQASVLSVISVFATRGRLESFPVFSN